MLKCPLNVRSVGFFLFCRPNRTSSNYELSQHEVVTPSIPSSSGVATQSAKKNTATTSSDHNIVVSSVSRSTDMCSCDTHRNVASFSTCFGKRKRRSSTKVSRQIVMKYFITFIKFLILHLFHMGLLTCECNRHKVAWQTAKYIYSYSRLLAESISHVRPSVCLR